MVSNYIIFTIDAAHADEVDLYWMKGNLRLYPGVDPRENVTITADHALAELVVDLTGATVDEYYDYIVEQYYCVATTEHTYENASFTLGVKGFDPNKKRTLFY